MRTLLMWLCGIICCTTMKAQYNVLTSPVINQDGSVTFRIHAPKAKEVGVRGQFKSGTTPLTKDSTGTWSVTISSIKPDIYPYNFVIDGVSVADPGNTMLFPNESFKSSLLELPNPKALYTVNDVPHGKVHYCTYRSTVLNQYRNVLVYTPAEYDKNPNKKYPVFYLISGTTDTEETWYKVGRANTILDNLIAQGQAEPMIVVMPYGYMNNGTPRPSTPQAADMYSVFAKELTECVMPYVESNYRTINDREHRAIAGFSRGGGQSMFTALSHHDKFAWLGSYSAYLTPQVMDAYFPDLKKRTDTFKMIWFCVGTSDFLYQDVVRNHKYFDKKTIRYEQVTRSGSHTWMHARYCLAETYKKLFRQKYESKRFPSMTIDSGSLPGYSIYQPTDMAKAKKEHGSLPVFIFGNGGCSHNSGDYMPMFAELVNNGYIVIAVGTPDGKLASVPADYSASGKDDNLLDAVDWVCKQNSDPTSEYYQSMDRFNIAVGGHSCGGAQAIAASYDPRIKTTIVLNAGMGNMHMAGASAESLKHLHSPILYLIGGPKDVAYPNAAIDVKNINHVAVVSANFPVGHGGTYREPQGGLLGKLTLQWLDWHLKSKKEAATFFTNSSWRKKHYPDCVFESKGMK